MKVLEPQLEIILFVFRHTVFLKENLGSKI